MTGRLRPRPSAVWPLALLVGTLLAIAGCDGSAGDERIAALGGDPDLGRELFVEYGCATCHQISGVRQAVGRVGPHLDDYAEQRIIAGVLPNTPEHLAAWIQQPREYAPNTGMPDVGVTPEDSVHLTAFILQQR